MVGFSIASLIDCRPDGDAVLFSSRVMNDMMIRKLEQVQLGVLLRPTSAFHCMLLQYVSDQ